MTLEFDRWSVVPTSGLGILVVYPNLVNSAIVKVVDVPSIEERSSVCVVNADLDLCVYKVEL